MRESITIIARLIFDMEAALSPEQQRERADRYIAKIELADPRSDLVSIKSLSHQSEADTSLFPDWNDGQFDTLGQTFFATTQSDDESYAKVSEALARAYQQNPAGTDAALIALCGYCFKTLCQKAGLVFEEWGIEP